MVILNFHNFPHLLWVNFLHGRFINYIKELLDGEYKHIISVLSNPRPLGRCRACCAA